MEHVESGLQQALDRLGQFLPTIMTVLMLIVIVLMAIGVVALAKAIFPDRSQAEKEACIDHGINKA